MERGTQDRPQLGEEQLRIGQAVADRPQAERRVQPVERQRLGQDQPEQLPQHAILGQVAHTLQRQFDRVADWVSIEMPYVSVEGRVTSDKFMV